MHVVFVTEAFMRVMEADVAEREARKKENKKAATHLKLKGNEQYAAGNYEAAIEYYTQVSCTCYIIKICLLVVCGVCACVHACVHMCVRWLAVGSVMWEYLHWVQIYLQNINMFLQNKHGLFSLLYVAVLSHKLQTIVLKRLINTELFVGIAEMHCPD